ncbi:MBL fold metallo-hydrolase [Aestuariispira ectoiniformans]|uniref:MBL fold metallo-hydrolase n=1 Tax=Aestuariispira ectoiniformans TaxID=2775080 RepID=UPI00223A9EFD|nr:MBL fold metallo-hydrolase [Aestuariispira ectoiniformans]
MGERPESCKSLDGINLTFCGAAGTVTGSCYLIEHADGRFLVDCGMFQGNKTLKSLNYGAFPFDPATIDFVLLTHAHIDHSGLIPKLCKHGFKGPVHMTEPTASLLAFMLPDSGHIQESEVRLLNRRNVQRGRRAVQPIYSQREAINSLNQLQTVDYDEWMSPGEGVRARFWNAGHILGSASVEIEVQNGESGPIRLVFSGDIGPLEKEFHDDPEGPAGVDYLISEGTYGSREREDQSVAHRREILKQELLDGYNAGGNILIPAFAVERTQELLFDISWLIKHSQIPPMPVFLDSPMAIEATRTFARYADLLQGIGDEREFLSEEDFRATETVEESKEIAKISGGAIIIAASGMCDAGRIRHHLKNNLWRDNATVIFVGYQAPGTLGNLLLEGKNPVRIHGEEVSVRARIRRIETYSAHADQSELVAWVEARMPVQNAIFLSHGEASALEVLRGELIKAGCQEDLIHVPQIDDCYHLTGKGYIKQRHVPHRVEQEEIVNTDWHNDYAGFLSDLSRELSAMPDNKERQKMLRRLQGMITGHAVDDRHGKKHHE